MSELVARLCKRLSELKAARNRLEPHWSECYRYAAPERQQSFIGDDVTDTRKTQRAELLDSTLSEATQLLVSSIIQEPRQLMRCGLKLCRMVLMIQPNLQTVKSG